MIRNLIANLIAYAAKLLGLDRRYLAAISGPGKITTLLFLCQGNICRSPYAAKKMEQLLSSHGEGGIQILSAGVATVSGKPADALAAEVAAERGVDLSFHRSSPVTVEMIRSADLILIMDPQQHSAIRKLDNDGLKKTLFLGALLLRHGGRLTVDDPYGCPPAAFHIAFHRIDQALNILLDEII